MSISDDLALLTQGAVFLNKKGRTAKLLFVTNTALDAKVQVTHPPQVVYINDEGEVYNRDIDDFLAKYKFYNVDPDLENRLENLFVFSEDDPALEAVADSEVLFEEKSEPKQYVAPQVPQTPQTTKLVADALKVLPSEEDSLLLPPQKDSVPSVKSTAPALTIDFGTLGNPLAIASELLALTTSLIAYSQEPDLTQNLVIHRLTFALDTLSIAELQNLFRPRDDESDARNTVDTFDVLTSTSSESILWTSYLGVFPEYTKNGLYATVMVGTDEFQGNPPLEVQETQVEEQVLTATDINDVATTIDPASLEVQAPGTFIQIHSDSFLSQNSEVSTVIPGVIPGVVPNVVADVVVSTPILGSQSPDIPGAL